MGPAAETAAVPQVAVPAPAATAAPAPMAATGGAAILARLRAQRASSGGGTGAHAAGSGANAAAARREPPRAAFLYASQTGTGAEIARTLAAEAKGRGVAAEAMSLNELGWANFRAERTPVAVIVASSTGDGDPPDNGAAFFVALKKPHPADTLAGVRFAVLGLGDSNYTRFMHVPRTLRARLADLGASEFYCAAEADEVDGLESKVDPWCENIWSPLKEALAAAAGSISAPTDVAATAQQQPQQQRQQPQQQQQQQQQQEQPPPKVPQGLVDGLAPEGVDLSGAPALAAPRIEVVLGVTPEVGQRARARNDACPSPEQIAHRDETGTYSAVAPFWAKVAGARLMTARGSDRVVVHVELDIAGSGMAYTAGDSIGVLAQNNPVLVDGLLQRMGLDGDAVFEVKPADHSASGAALLQHVQWPCTLRQALTQGVDVTSVPRKSLLRTLAEHCSDAAEKRTLLFLCSRAGREDYVREMAEAQPTLLDLLKRFKSCTPPLAALLDALPPLAPRMYSVCCAPPPGGTPAARIEFAYSLVTLATPSGPQRGVATGWLTRELEPWLRLSATTDGPAPEAGDGGRGAVWVPVFLRPTDTFGPPRELSTPLVMIGPGTGVAPFRGFVQQRHNAAVAAAGGEDAVPLGEAWLYFGCRRRSEDFLFGEELEAWAARGDLARLRVAFSREHEGEGGAKTYVQHLMEQDGAALAALVVRDGAHIYVCGDGVGMARNVHAALAAVLREHAGMGEAEAEAHLKAMTARGAYVRDVWSV